MRVTTRHLGPLATQLTGKHVEVRIGHDLGDADGVASHDGSQYVIHIHPRNFELSRKGTLTYVLLHEAGHIAKGHVPMRTHAITREAIDRETQQTIVNEAYMASKHAQRIEAEAHEWAWSQADNVPVWYVWELVTSE
jgi:hypothetical protein